MSLIAIILFVCMPFMAIPVVIVGIIVDRKHSYIYALLLAIIFAIIAYNFRPNETQDLYRYYVEMRTHYSNISFEVFIQELFSNTKVIFKTLQYFIALTQNYNLLPFICTLFGYFISFYMILDCAKEYKLKPSLTVIILFIFVLSFYHINFLSGLAQYLAISIGVLGFYLEYVKNKKKSIYKILYIVSFLIHASMIIIPIIRILLNFDYKKIKKVYLIVLIMYAFLPTIIYQIFNILPGMQTIAQKMNYYLLQGNGISTTFEIVSLLLLVLYIFIFYRTNRKNKLVKNTNLNKYFDFVEMILLLNIFSIFYKDIFLRIFNISILSMLIYIIIYLKNSNKENIILILILCIFSVLIGSVNLNILLANNFGDVFTNITENLFYYFK